MNKKALIILGTVLVVGTVIGMVAYKSHRTKMTTSENKEKNDRKIVLVEDDGKEFNSEI